MCPACGQPAEIVISVNCWATLDSSGFTSFHGIEYDDDSAAYCPNKEGCEFEGTWSDFEVEEVDDGQHA